MNETETKPTASTAKWLCPTCGGPVPRTRMCASCAAEVGTALEDLIDKGTEPTEYRVSATRLPVVQARFAKLAKRAAKLSVPAATLSIRETTEQVRDRYWDGDPRVWPTHAERVFYVTVDGISPRLPGGWKLAATIQHTEVGNSVRAAQTGLDLTMYRKGTPDCEHCHTARNRRDTYVVVNDEGLVRQVGSNCIADFLGGTDPEAIAAYAGSVLDAVGDLEAEYESFSGIRDRNSVNLPEYLAETVAAIDAHGWLSKSRAGYDQTPTASHATENLFAICQRWPTCYKHNTSHRSNARPTEEQVQEADAALTWLRDSFEVRTNLDDFEWNLSVAIGRDWVEPRETGIAAYGIVYYRNALEKELKQREQAKRRDAEAGPAPRGREQVTGVVMNLKSYEGYMPDSDPTLKMTVLLENGSTVWATVPAAIDPSRGDTVQFTATFEAGRNDPDDSHFAVGKRPTKASILKGEDR